MADDEVRLFSITFLCNLYLYSNLKYFLEKSVKFCDIRIKLKY